MNAQDLTLNIAVNMGRLSKWALEGKKVRVEQFILDTETYLNELEDAPKNKKFQSTYTVFKDKFFGLKNNLTLDEVWAEEALTWANILTHRAKLA